MHRNAILLLDEPGIHLHLQAQFNLINFFQKLKETNQIIYTTHSPFLIDENHLEQVRSVYEDETGITHITENNLIPDKKSIFPLQAALSYKTSQVIYQGLKQLLVEGDSDYNYIKAISAMLAKLGKKSLDKDIVILPCKGASKIEKYARLFRDLENIPVVLLDSDEECTKAYERLFDSLFAEYKSNLLMIGDFLSNKKNVEIEDLIGKKILAEIINKNNITDSPVSEKDIGGDTFVNSLIAYCNKNKIKFKQKNGWKYQLSLKFNNEIYQLDKDAINNKFPENQIKVFEKLIEKINKYAKKKIKD
jgi:predicted ATP-dependent endonuclease of OLD family